MKPIINLLQRGLDGSSLRQKALSDNIANVNTPDYKRKDVDFISVLKEQAAKGKGKNLSLSKTNNKHLTTEGANRPFKMYSRTYTSYKNDGNNVDIDFEMAESAKNNLYYNTLVGQINNRFGMINNVIEKGGRN